MHVPYTSINGVNFDSTEDQIENNIGAPCKTRVNNIGYKELDYGDAVYRFNENGILKEVTTNAPFIHLPTSKVAFASLNEFIYKQDSEAFTAAGFHVSPKYGLAFDQDFPSWVTFFARSELELWKKYNT